MIYFLMKNKFLRVIITSFALTACTAVGIEAQFPTSRIDLYVIDVSKSIVGDPQNPSSELFSRVENRIRADIANNALGSPALESGSRNIAAKPALGLYVQMMGDRASDNRPEQIRTPEGSIELWNKVQEMDLNEGNLTDLWAKIQEISGQVLNSGEQTQCNERAFDSLEGQSGDEKKHQEISSLICQETIGALTRLEEFNTKLSEFLQDTGGTPGSDIYQTIKNTHSWISTIKDNQIDTFNFNFIILSDMVHDADSEKDLNRLIPQLSKSEIVDVATKQARELGISFSGLNTKVFIVGLGAFGPNYETKANFVSSLQDYWTAYFEELGIYANFTPTLDDVRLG
jgi:hypothetical protein